MKYTPIFLLIILILASGCASPSPRPIELPPDTAVTSPPEGTMPSTTPEIPRFSPQNGDIDFTRSDARLEKTELIIRESYPPQISLGMSGNLPTPCHQLRVAINEPDSEKRIMVDVYFVVDPKKSCIQVLKPFQEYVDLGTFPSGHYSVWVNGEQVGEFDS